MRSPVELDESVETRAAARWGGAIRVSVTVAGTYVYFLLFAQFAFLELLQDRLREASGVEAAMAAMGMAGALSSLAAARALRKFTARTVQLAGFAGCALTALLANLAGEMPPDTFGLRMGLLTAGALTGIATAFLTVSVAAGLQHLGGTTRSQGHVYRAGSGPGLATSVGVGTGLAYLLSNIPSVFESSVWVRSLVAIAACGVGYVAVRGSGKDVAAGDRAVFTRRRLLRRTEFTAFGLATLVASFSALVWLDSAAFAIIQENPVLKGRTWGSGAQTTVIGIVHFLAAAGAGWLLDRGRLRSLLVVAFALLAGGFHLLDAGGMISVFAAPLYAVGISVYSTALVAYPAAGRDGPGVVPVRWRAAVLFGLAGWIGSALGIGMAQSLQTIPRWFTWAAGSVIVLSGLLSVVSGRGLADTWRQRRGTLQRVGRLFGLTIALGVGPFLVFKGEEARRLALVRQKAPESSQSTLEARGDDEELTVAGLERARLRGREVYIREGCINCHSQYVRPGTADVLLWGPYREIDSSEEPPLLGNRRQGPDLRNVGNRRSAVWQRLHLQAPEAVVPGSRMPSYAHLFRDGSSEGEDLVAYLSSLGRATGPDRVAAVRSAEIRSPGSEGSTARGQMLFDRYCGACHGRSAHGDGPLGLRVATDASAMDLVKKSLTLVSRNAEEDEANAIARVVKFGIPGTSMPGHEYFSDQEVADIVAFLHELRHPTSERCAQQAFMSSDTGSSRDCGPEERRARPLEDDVRSPHGTPAEEEG